MSALSTKFAPAERAGSASLQRQSQMLLDVNLLETLYGAVNEIVLILNAQRQIVFYNRPFAEMVGNIEESGVVGMRPGEALGCIYSCEAGGCGTSEFCSTCGAVQAIISAQKGTPDVKECRILRAPQSEAMDLLVRATPLKIKSEEFTIFSVQDISHEKRRHALERLFFHDLMNTAVAIKMLSGNLSRTGFGNIGEISSSIQQGVQQLIEEINSQRDLLRAENNELTARPASLSSKTLLIQLLETYNSFARARNCEVQLNSQAEDITFQSDPTIVGRVIGNMIKNALEASKAEQTVTVTAQHTGTSVVFSVHNAAYIPRDIQLQIFKRSFTTKGAGRGLGTYSMKLLTERYLGGEITFDSSESDGTLFKLRLNL